MAASPPPTASRPRRDEGARLARRARPRLHAARMPILSDVTIFGSVNADLTFPVPLLPAPGHTVLSGPWRAAPGGKGANQAVAAAHDGAPVRFVGAVGRDPMAAVALSAL